MRSLSPASRGRGLSAPWQHHASSVLKAGDHPTQLKQASVPLHGRAIAQVRVWWCGVTFARIQIAVGLPRGLHWV